MGWGFWGPASGAQEPGRGRWVTVCGGDPCRTPAVHPAWPEQVGGKEEATMTSSGPDHCPHGPPVSLLFSVLPPRLPSAGTGSPPQPPWGAQQSLQAP